MSRQPWRGHGVWIQRTLRQQEKCLAKGHVLSLHGMPNIPQIGQPALRFDGNIGSSRRQVFRAEQVRNGWRWRRIAGCLARRVGGGRRRSRRRWICRCRRCRDDERRHSAQRAAAGRRQRSGFDAHRSPPAVYCPIALLLVPSTWTLDSLHCPLRRTGRSTCDRAAAPGGTRFTWEFTKHAAPCPNCGVAML